VDCLATVVCGDGCLVSCGQQPGEPRFGRGFLRIRAPRSDGARSVIARSPRPRRCTRRSGDLCSATRRARPRAAFQMPRSSSTDDVTCASTSAPPLRSPETTRAAVSSLCMPLAFPFAITRRDLVRATRPVRARAGATCSAAASMPRLLRGRSATASDVSRIRARTTRTERAVRPRDSAPRACSGAARRARSGRRGRG